MGNLFAELKRRHIYRVAAAYTVVAWLLLQLVNNVAPVLDLPPWVARTILLVLVIGFPLALLLAWIVEAAPEPARGKGKRGVAQPVADSPVDWVLAGALALVIGIFAYQQIAPSPPAANQQASVEAARAAAATQAGISIAVLPFTNLSSDAEQEFFSDGMTEEITSALAKVPDLRVVGRTSAFQFKGQNQDLRAIGQALSATHLIEGSVRKADNRVRITVQLIRADDGTHLWAENYDRQLTDIFAIQEDIARAITNSLRMPLGLKPGENLVNNRGLDPESYQQFLRAKALVRARRQGLAQALEILEPLVARYPGYAPAWAQLSLMYQRKPLDFLNATVEEWRRAADEWLPKAQAAAERAIALDANLADGYSTLGLTAAYRGRLVQAEGLFSKALALDPFYPEALHAYGNLLGAVGRLKEALAMREQLIGMEPFVPVYNGPMNTLLALNGQTDTAIARLKAPRAVRGRAILLASLYAEQGRYTEAVDELRAIPQGNYPDGMLEAAVRLLRTAPAVTASPQSLPQLGPDLDFVYLAIGAPERFLQPLEDNVAAGILPPVRMLPVWYPSAAPLRKTARFKTFARNAGLVAYWRAKGWPEFCHPTTGDDFECS